MALMSNFQSYGSHNNYKGKKGNCNYCGQPGHWIPDCPILKKKNKASSSQINASDRKKKNWRKTAPATGASETITKEGRKYYWCQTCKRWTETHSTATHVVGFGKGDKDKSTDVVASASLAIDPSAWLCSTSTVSTFGRLRSFILRVSWILFRYSCACTSLSYCDPILSGPHSYC